jgi:hypothetical protein
MEFGFSESNTVNMRFGFLNQGGDGLDPDASQFITNWEISTGTTMLETQRLAVNDLYRGLKGQGTANGSDLLTLAQSVNALIFPLVPLTDSTANANAYKLDAVSNGVFQGSYTNMVAGDFTAQGVIGGLTKFFNTLTPQNAYTIDDLGFAFYGRTNLGAANTADVGSGLTVSTNSILSNPRNATNLLTYRVNDSVNSSLASTDSRGFRLIQRSGTLKEVYADNTLLGSTILAVSASGARNVYFHAYNNAGTTAFESTRQLCFYMLGMPYLTLAQAQDFYTVIQRFQSNVITGGRQIGAAIPPIS